MSTVTAVAGWLEPGPTPSNLSLQVTEMSSGSAGTLFLFISQQYCDVPHNREVSRTFQGEQTVSPGQFSVGPRVDSAALQVSAVTLAGSQTVLKGCSSPSSVLSTKSLRPSRASLDVVWSAIGPMTQIQPGIRGRPAAADGFETSNGPVDLGNLGPSNQAQLRVERS